MLHCTTGNDGKIKLRDSSILSLSLYFSHFSLAQYSFRSRIGRSISASFLNVCLSMRYILRKSPPPIDVRSVLLPVQAPRLMNNLTRFGKQAMNDGRCDHCAQHEHDDSCCIHPLEYSLAIGRRSGALPRSKKRHRTKGRTAFSAVCHGPANIQATSAVECDLWYGVRRPYVALVCRCYTDLERAKNLES